MVQIFATFFIQLFVSTKHTTHTEQRSQFARPFYNFLKFTQLTIVGLTIGV